MPEERRKAIFFITVSALSLSLMAACVKSVKTLPFMEIVFVRSAVGLVLMLGLVPLTRASFLGKKRRGALLVRGWAGAFAVACHFFSLAKLPLATAMLLNHTAPIMIVIMAVLFLKENVTRFVWLLVLGGFMGTLLLLSPNLTFEPLACAAGLASGVLAAVAMISIRYIGKDESVFTSIFYFVLIATILSAPLALPLYVPPSHGEWLGLIGVGFFSFLGQIWLTSAFRIGPASIVTPFNYLAPVFSYLLGFLFWGEILTVTATAGAVIIIACGAALSHYARRT